MAPDGHAGLTGDDAGNDTGMASETTPLLAADKAAPPTPPLLEGEPLPGHGEGNGNGNGSGVSAGGTTDQESGSAARGEEDERTIIADELPPAKLFAILSTAWVGVFLGAIDSTIIATLSAPISSEFHSLSLLSWLATAYLIANAACQPISGRLTDIFGRGPGLVFSNLFFAAGNLLCGLARDEREMILGRVVAGIGGGGLMSISTFLGSDLVPLRQRGLIQGVGNICYGSGAMLGGVFGGWVNDHTQLGWRLAFLVQVPPVLLSAVLVAWLVRVPPKESNRSYLARIDFGGVFLTVSFLVLLLLGLNTGGNLVPWLHPLPLTTIPLSVVAFVGFLLWESRARQPIIPVRLLFNRTILAACMCLFLATMVVMMGLFYVPLYLQVNGHSATEAGLRVLSSPVGVSICSIGSGYIMKRTGRYVGLGIVLQLASVTGVLLFTTQGFNTPGWVTSLAFFLVGGSYGGMLTVTLLACISAVDHSQQAVITSATYLARSMGSTIGVTVGSTVYQNILRARLWDRFGEEPDAADKIRRIRDDLDELKHLPPGWEEGVMDSFMEAFRGVWLTMLVLSIGSLICISLMKQHVLHNTLSRK